MCRRSEGLDALTKAARCLTEACVTRIATSAALRGTYQQIVDEPVPEEMRAALDRLGKEQGHA